MANRNHKNPKLEYKYRNNFGVTCHPEELKRKFPRKPKKIFLCSMGDLFHRKVPFEFIDLIMGKIGLNPQHTFQILTKRPARALYHQEHCSFSWPDNIWFGVTAENREQTLKRISYLYEIQARIKFVSFEPLLERISFDPLPVNWVIVGGETGPKARSMDPDWVRSIKKTCGHLHIPFFFKQMSKKQPTPEDLNIKQFPGA
jgi:protein gp37